MNNNDILTAANAYREMLAEQIYASLEENHFDEAEEAADAIEKAVVNDLRL